MALPTQVADPVLMSRVAMPLRVTNPVGRVLKALGLG